MQSIHTLLKFAQLSWTGHVTRKPDERLPKKILYGELQVGKRSHGGQKKRYKDTLKASLKDFNIPTESWEQIAQDRTKWRGLIKREAEEYEAKRISEAKQKRAQRKTTAKASPTELSFSNLSCSICNRQFRANMVSSAILEHTNNNTSHSWLGLVIVSNDRRTREEVLNRLNAQQTKFHFIFWRWDQHTFVLYDLPLRDAAERDR